jgi:hypothetical protein
MNGRFVPGGNVRVTRCFGLCSVARLARLFLSLLLLLLLLRVLCVRARRGGLFVGIALPWLVFLGRNENAERKRERCAFLLSSGGCCLYRDRHHLKLASCCCCSFPHCYKTWSSKRLFLFFSEPFCAHI